MLPRDKALKEYKESINLKFTTMEAVQQSKDNEQDKKLSGDDRRLCALEIKNGGERCEPRE